MNNLEVLYEDNHIIAVNKRASDIVQGDKTGDISLADEVKTFLKKKYNKPGDVFLGTVHRLDRPVSGVVMFAKTSKALARLNQMFQDKTVEKVYWAVCEQKPPLENELITHFLKKDQKKNKSRGYEKEVKGSKKCQLRYNLLGRTSNYFFVEIHPKTGRHHQIRVQLSAIGSVIKGDLKYGAKRSNRDGSICLHARKLRFLHPVKKEDMEITAPAPSKDALWQECVRLSEP